jgi:putative two-component system response regulator
MKKIIFIVDDNEINLIVAKEVLKDYYNVMTMSSASKMFSLLETVKPSLILLDIDMPEMDGKIALKNLKANKDFSDIPVIFLTGIEDPKIEAEGFESGAVDFIKKPFSQPVLLNRIKAHLDIDAIIHERTSQLKQRTIQLQNLQNAIIFGFADLVESRDTATGGHIERTSQYIKVLTDAIIELNLYTDETNMLDMDLFVSSARLHDVGKIAISDTILNKPGKLTDEEYEIMKTHTIEGERAIEQIASRTDDNEFLRNAKLFAGYHHERWDGEGYPNKLSGTNIPIQGRVMAIVDTYDALVSVRPYKKAFSHEDATEIIMENAGTHFDPKLSQAFYEVSDKFNAITLSV